MIWLDILSSTLACSDPCRTFTSINWFTDGDGNQSGWWGSCKILVSEARIWSVARSAVQIQNSMVQVSPSSEGLEAYWRLNEGEGKNFVDATGHNHQDKLIQCEIEKAYTAGINYTDRKTCRMISGEVVLPNTPTVTGFGSYNPCACVQTASTGA